jgi:hypothetical protein
LRKQSKPNRIFVLGIGDTHEHSQKFKRKSNKFDAEGRESPKSIAHNIQKKNALCEKEQLAETTAKSITQTKQRKINGFRSA